MLNALRQIAIGGTLSLLMSLPAFGQASLLPNAKQQFISPNGQAYDSGTVDMYVPNTSTRKNTWQTPTQSGLNTNPITLDSAGRAVIYGVGSYRQVVKDKHGNAVWDGLTAAPLTGSTPATSGSGDFLPIGAIIQIAGYTAPTNYVLAYGQPISRTTYSDAWAALTISGSASCTASSTTIGGITDTSQIKVGAPIEASCLSPGTTVATIAGASSITVSAAAINSGTVTIRVFNYGNGDGNTTFNLPDFRGNVSAGADCMGGVCASRLTSTYFNGVSGGLPGTPGAQSGSGGASAIGSQSRALATANLPPYTPAGLNTAPHITVGGGTIGGTLNIANPVGGGTSPFSGATITAALDNAPVFAGTAQGGISSPVSVVQPTLTVNYAVKVLNGTLPTVGVLSLGGMTGDVLCGTGLSCAGGTIAATGIATVPLNASHIFVGNGSNLASDVALSGDCTIAIGGAITCTKTSGVSFGAFATGTSANNLTGTNVTLSGSVPASNAGGVVQNTSSSGAAVWQVTNNNGTTVGILQALGSAYGGTNFGVSGNNLVQFASLNASAMAVGTGDSVPLVLGTNNAERVRVLANGNVGIGSSTPGYLGGFGNVLLLSGQAAGANQFASLGVGGNITGTANAVGTFDFVNTSLGAGDKRIASVGALTDGATNSGKFLVSTFNAGAASTWLSIDHIGATTLSGASTFASTVKMNGIPSGTTPGCVANDASGNLSGGNACSGGGMPAGGSLAQAPLNSAAGTASWRTQPFTNIAALTGADCTGVVATVISTVIGSIKSVALPNDCLLKISGSDTVPAGVLFAIPCGARVQVDGAAVLTFNAQTDDNTCQKFSASGVGSGSGGGIVKGLRLNRPEWWGAVGDCDYLAATCTHDDSGPLQQAFNSAFASGSSSGGVRPQVKLGCGKGYGVSTGVNAFTDSSIQLESGGCGSLHTVAGQSGSAIIGRSGFTGSVLTVKMNGAGPDNIDFYLHDFGIASINAGSTDTCLQIGAAGQNMANGGGRSLIDNLRIDNCKHAIKYAGQVVTLKHNRIWMTMPSTGASSCIEAIPSGTDALSEFTFDTVACVSNNNASSISFNIHPTGSTFAITGWRLTDAVCYGGTTCSLFQADGSSIIADVWINSAQADAMLVNGMGFGLVSTGTAQIVDVVFNQSYATNVGAMTHVYNIDGSAGGTIKNIGIYGAYMATGSTLRGIRVTDASQIQIQGARIGGTYVNQGMLINNCTGCMMNNNIFSGSVPNFILLGGSTDYAQACNNTASGALAPAAVSGSIAAGTHNIYFGSGYQTCQNN